MELLNVDKVSVSYGKIAAVRDVSLQVKAGSIVTIIGPNGAGKTTLLKSLMALLPSSGSVNYLGQSLEKLNVQARVSRGMFLVPESRELFAQMTVAENMELGAYSRKDGKRAIRDDEDKIYGLFPRLAERRKQIAGTLSGGERQMLALGRALMARPKILMLDEPSLGLAPIIVREIFRIISQLRTMDVSILLVEQNARAALQTADYAYVLETGEIVHSGPAAELINHPKVMSTYLGNSAASQAS